MTKPKKPEVIYTGKVGRPRLRENAKGPNKILIGAGIVALIAIIVMVIWNPFNNSLINKTFNATVRNVQPTLTVSNTKPYRGDTISYKVRFGGTATALKGLYYKLRTNGNIIVSCKSAASYPTYSGTLKANQNDNILLTTYNNSSCSGNIIVQKKLNIYPQEKKAETVDKTAPTCTIDKSSITLKVGKSTTLYLTCKDNRGVVGKYLSTTYFNYSMSIVSIALNSTNKRIWGTSSTIPVTIKAKSVGTDTLSLKVGAIKDGSGNDVPHTKLTKIIVTN